MCQQKCVLWSKLLTAATLEKTILLNIVLQLINKILINPEQNTYTFIILL